MHTQQTHALKKLSTLVDDFWAEIADFVINIESLSEDEDFGSKDLAAIVASKVSPEICWVYGLLGNII